MVVRLVGPPQSVPANLESVVGNGHVGPMHCFIVRTFKTFFLESNTYFKKFYPTFFKKIIIG